MIMRSLTHGTHYIIVDEVNNLSFLGHFMATKEGINFTFNYR